MTYLIVGANYPFSLAYTLGGKIARENCPFTNYRATLNKMFTIIYKNRL
jgi:hypothetical protein